jgi:transposase-like protein
MKGNSRERAYVSHRRHRFPPAIISHAVYLYYRIAVSYRDVEEMLRCAASASRTRRLGDDA